MWDKKMLQSEQDLLILTGGMKNSVKIDWNYAE